VSSTHFGGSPARVVLGSVRTETTPWHKGKYLFTFSQEEMKKEILNA
jgi:hypothetical protein